MNKVLCILYLKVGISGQSIEEACSWRVRHKVATILNDSTHPLKFSFVPSAISVFNTISFE